MLEHAERDHPPDRAGKRHPLRLEDRHRTPLDAGIDFEADVRRLCSHRYRSFLDLDIVSDTWSGKHIRIRGTSFLREGR